MQVIWDHHDPFYLFAGTDGGSLCCLDVRRSTPVFTEESAHTSALSALALSPTVTGCLVSASTDHSVKLWDVRGHLSPNLVRRRLCKIGEVHCAAACPDEPLLFCVGGQTEMKLLNFRNDETVTEKFALSDPDFTGETATNVSPSDNTANHISPDNPNTGKKIRKSKTTGPVLSSTSSDTASKSCESDRADRKVSKKRKKSKIELHSSVKKEVQTLVKQSHVKSKRLKDKKAKSN